MAKTDHTRLRAARRTARKRSTDTRRGPAAAAPLHVSETDAPPQAAGIRDRLEGAVALAACARQAARANFARARSARRPLSHARHPHHRVRNLPPPHDGRDRGLRPSDAGQCCASCGPRFFRTKPARGRRRGGGGVGPQSPPTARSTRRGSRHSPSGTAPTEGPSCTARMNTPAGATNTDRTPDP
jgi:hypothetical protein